MEFLKLIEQLHGSRKLWKIKHSLSTLLFCTLSAVFFGAESWSDISDFVSLKLAGSVNMLISATVFRLNLLSAEFLPYLSPNN